MLDRSASFLLRHIISNLGDKLFELKDGPSYLKLVYRALKRIVQPLSRRKNSPYLINDSIVLHHANVALNSLEEIVHRSLFFDNYEAAEDELMQRMTIRVIR